MRKIFTLVGVLAIVSTGAFAQGKKAAPKEIACAVMTSNKLDVAKATKSKMYADYKGNRYYFCCGGCPEAFKKNPAKYAKNAHLPIPKKK